MSSLNKDFITDLNNIISSTSSELKAIENYIENSDTKDRIVFLQQAISNENIWQNPQVAGQLTKELRNKEGFISKFERLKKDLLDIKELLALSMKSNFLLEEIEAIFLETKEIANRISKERVKILFNSEDDTLPCLIEIKSGAGGLEAQDWAEMLFNMYYKFAADEYKAEVIEHNKKDVGIDSATIRVFGTPESFPYGNLKGETGTHRLVRPSPFNKNNKRHTSFAEVFVAPIRDMDINIEILDKDIRIDTYRASGAGGQHVNRTDSAVRITHLPTGIVAQSQNDRSQHRNKAEAMKTLKLKLYAAEEKRRQVASPKKGLGGWGQQIRSYVLDDSMIKDLRTGFESRQPDKVLNGDLGPFLLAYINYIATASV